MFWVVVIVIVVGFFIVRAINRNTANNAVIAQQQYLNSPEYSEQLQASLDYEEYMGDITRLDTMITGTRISHAMDIAEGKTDKKTAMNNERLLKNYEQQKQLTIQEYQKKREQNDKYGPELPIENIYNKYLWEVADDGYSPLDIYNENLKGLEKLKKRLIVVSDKNYDPYQELNCDYQEAVSIVIGTGKANTSLLQSRMEIGYQRAELLIQKLEKGGIIGPADGVRHEVLVKNSDARSKAIKT
jgi:DNA segregation ATPase FtsK/SpoIIIE-like protein